MKTFSQLILDVRLSHKCRSIQYRKMCIYWKTPDKQNSNHGWLRPKKVWVGVIFFFPSRPTPLTASPALTDLEPSFISEGPAHDICNARWVHFFWKFDRSGQPHWAGPIKIKQNKIKTKPKKTKRNQHPSFLHGETAKLVNDDPSHYTT